MQFTCTLWSRTSSARHSTSLTTAVLDAAYAVKLGRVYPEPGPPRRIILPERFSIIDGSTARQLFTVPIRLISIASLHAFGLVRTRGPIGPNTPAAPIRISRLP